MRNNIKIQDGHQWTWVCAGKGEPFEKHVELKELAVRNLVEKGFRVNEIVVRGILYSIELCGFICRNTEMRYVRQLHKRIFCISVSYSERG